MAYEDLLAASESDNQAGDAGFEHEALKALKALEKLDAVQPVVPSRPRRDRRRLTIPEGWTKGAAKPERS